MPATIRKNDATSDTRTTIHPPSPGHSAAIAALRSRSCFLVVCGLAHQSHIAPDKRACDYRHSFT